MDIVLVSTIVAAALFFTIRSFVKIYRGEKSCDCDGCQKDCSGTLNESCGQEFPVARK